MQGGRNMLQIPKNVMQIGEINAHTKIYMEDYVHTFLERRKEAEEYLAFGKKEERSDVTIYLIYGVERKSDWNRGSFPYFKKYERIGTIEGTAGKRAFRPVRGAGIPLSGYFVFYEQNEDMQSYMIVMRETEAMGGSEEKEEVLEAVRVRREKRVQEARENLDAPVYRRSEAGSTMKPPIQEKKKKDRIKILAQVSERLQGRAGKDTVKARKDQRRIKAEKTHLPLRRTSEPRTFNIPDLCRAGCMLLLMILVVLGITSVNRYPDMKAVMQMFSDAARAVRGVEEGITEAEAQEEGLVVEETTGQIQWTIGQNAAENESGENVQPAETFLVEETPVLENTMQDQPEESEAEQKIREPEEGDEQKAAGAESVGQADAYSETDKQENTETDTTQAIARPASYVVKKGDNLAEIARRFYGNTSMIKEICAVNKIEDPDQIHAGQNILLP